jgi:Phosphatidylinositol 3- and 4-kinase/Phosphoinositide 3-kinase family, accessory domain (PIK domain)/Phosphoinositide 3-kinase C2
MLSESQHAINELSLVQKVSIDVYDLHRQLVAETAKLLAQRNALRQEIEQDDDASGVDGGAAGSSDDEAALKRRRAEMIKLKHDRHMQQAEINALRGKIGAMQLSLIQLLSAKAAFATMNRADLVPAADVSSASPTPNDSAERKTPPASPRSALSLSASETLERQALVAEIVRRSGRNKNASDSDLAHVNLERNEFSLFVEVDRFERERFDFPLHVTVDELKRAVFAKRLAHKDASQYWIGISRDEVCDVEFVPFLQSHPSLAEQLASSQAITIGVFPRVAGAVCATEASAHEATALASDAVRQARRSNAAQRGVEEYVRERCADDQVAPLVVDMHGVPLVAFVRRDDTVRGGLLRLADAYTSTLLHSFFKVSSAPSEYRLVDGRTGDAVDVDRVLGASPRFVHASFVVAADVGQQSANGGGGPRRTRRLTIKQRRDRRRPREVALIGDTATRDDDGGDNNNEPDDIVALAAVNRALLAGDASAATKLSSSARPPSATSPSSTRSPMQTLAAIKKASNAAASVGDLSSNPLRSVQTSSSPSSARPSSLGHSRVSGVFGKMERVALTVTLRADKSVASSSSSENESAKEKEQFEFQLEVPSSATLADVREMVAAHAADRGCLVSDVGERSFKVDGTDYFVMESAHQLIKRLPIMGYFVSRDMVPRFELATRAEATAARRIDLEVAHLLERPPTDWRIGNDDASDCRLRLARIIGEQASPDVSAVWAPTSVAPLPERFPEQFRANVGMMEVGAQKMVMVRSANSVADVVAAVCRKFAMQQARHIDAEHYTLRCSGAAQYFRREWTMHSIASVREAVRRQQIVQLSLVAIDALPPMIADVAEHTTRSFVDLIDAEASGNFDHAPRVCGERDTMSLFELRRPFEVRAVRAANLRAQLKELNVERHYLYVKIGIYHGGAPLCPPVYTSLQRLDADCSERRKKSGQSLWNEWLRCAIRMCDLPAEARICLTLYARSTKSSASAASATEKIALDGSSSNGGGASGSNIASSSSSSLDAPSPSVGDSSPTVVLVQRDTSATADSDESDESNGGGDSDVDDGGSLASSSSSLSLSSTSTTSSSGSAIAASALDDADHPSAVAVGNVNCLLFDFKGQLLSGDVTLKLWSDGAANPIGTCVENVRTRHPMTVTLNFHSFPCPVVFPRLQPAMAPLYDGVWAAYPVPSADDARMLRAIIAYDPLRHISPEHRQLLWHHREWCCRDPSVDAKALVKLLQCVQWRDVRAVRESYRLMEQWADLLPVDALELLDAKFADRRVRERAIRYLDRLSDEELRAYLLQLVQVLKYEPKHFSVLACWLIRRALANPVDIGHALFWHLLAEMHVPEISERYGTLLEFFLRHLSAQQRAEFAAQVRVQRSLSRIAGALKDVPSSRRKAALHAQLEAVELPSTFQLPLDPTRSASGVVVSRCKTMDSAKAPLWLVFENADPSGDTISVMFKAGDDLRQDQLTLQMMRIMDRIWKQAGLDLPLTPYGCIATGDELGFIEIVLDSQTMANIQAAAGGVTGAFKLTPIDNWLREHNPAPGQFESAVDNFVCSCAAYCVATYVLGIGDRHNDNIMLNRNGCLFHIDFGHFLGNVKTFLKLNRDRAPFILTPEMVYVMGGERHERFARFVDLACRGYNAIRRHATVFINLFAMMLSTGIPELRGEDDIAYLREAFLLGRSDAEASRTFTKLISSSIKSITTRINFASHILAHI